MSQNNRPTIPEFPFGSELESLCKFPYRKVLGAARELLQAGNVDEAKNIIRSLFLADLFFVAWMGLGRTDIFHPWVIKACYIVQDGPQTNTLDLWARGHYKSTLITHAQTIREILLSNGETSIAIFSHTKTAAESHLLPIKTAFETSNLLRWAFDDIIWENTRKAPIWSLQNGILLNRTSRSNTATVEAYGLIEGMPTGKHYELRVYDDLVTEDTVRSPDVMRKVERAFRLSDNLASKNGKIRVIGTIYSHADLYSTLLREAEDDLYPWNVRVFPWYDVKAYKETGIKTSVLLSQEEIKAKRSLQGPYVWSCQMELDPITDDTKRFSKEWIKYYNILPKRRNKYIFVDPANSKKKESDFTAIVVISIDELGNRYIEDIVRDRLDIGERWEIVSSMVRKHGPEITVYYEKYGLQTDISFFTEKMRLSGTYFGIVEVGGNVSKRDRIERLVPVFESGKFYLPDRPIIYNGRDMVKEFIEDELLLFPYSRHDDVLDAVSRVEDPQVGAMAPMPTWQYNKMLAYKNAKRQVEEVINI